MKRYTPERWAELRRYSTIANQWLIGKNCECCRKKYKRTRAAITVHHRRGRIGKLLLDKRFWCALCLECHQWVHQNPAEARSYRLICQIGQWNTMPAKKIWNQKAIEVLKRDSKIALCEWFPAQRWKSFPQTVTTRNPRLRPSRTGIGWKLPNGGRDETPNHSHLHPHPVPARARLVQERRTVAAGKGFSYAFACPKGWWLVRPIQCLLRWNGGSVDNESRAH
jgi:hypothetical protein